MIRDQIQQMYCIAKQNENPIALRIFRLILTAIQDRDNQETEIGDKEILSMLRTMIEQRSHSIKLYEQEGRLEDVEEEKQEVQIIQNLLPQVFDEQRTTQEIKKIIQDIGAHNVKDFKRIMTELHHRYPNEIHPQLACEIVKEALGCNGFVKSKTVAS